MSAPIMYHQNHSFESLRRDFFFYDHFYGSGIQDLWHGSGNAGGGMAVVDGVAGGICRITTGSGDNDYWQLLWNSKRSLLTTHNVAMEFRFKLEVSTPIYCLWGLDTGAYTNNTAFYTDTDTTSDWWIRCRNLSGTSEHNSNIALDTDYHIFRVQCHNHGGLHVHYYIDNLETDNSPLTTYIPTTHLQPLIFFRTREAAAHYYDMDYIGIRM